MNLPTLPRLGRRRFVAFGAITWIAFFAVRAALALAAVLALVAARLHDRNRSAWWLAVVLIPIVGALWLAWQTLCRRGSPGVNRYGPDPRQR